MNPKEQERMERYIYQVVRRLPGKQRKEVEEQLTELIGDMADGEGSVEKALAKLGDPAEFAKQYQDGERVLIGPEFYDSFLWLVKVVLLCTAIPLFCVNAAAEARRGMGLMEEGIPQAVVPSVLYGIVQTIPEIAAACLCAFGAIVLIFAVLEKKGIRLDLNKETKQAGWTPGCLPPVPPKKARISRADGIVGIVFIVLFGVLLIFAPEFFSAVVRDGEELAVVPIFNLEEWDRILPLFILGLAAGLFDEAFQLAAGRYCLPVLICNVLCSGIQLVLGYGILFALPLWNPDFVPRLQAIVTDPDLQRFLTWWNPELASVLLFLLCAAFAFLEAGIILYRMLRYAKK